LTSHLAILCGAHAMDNENENIISVKSETLQEAWEKHLNIKIGDNEYSMAEAKGFPPQFNRIKSHKSVKGSQVVSIGVEN
jgi:hypothetical protein